MPTGSMTRGSPPVHASPVERPGGPLIGSNPHEQAHLPAQQPSPRQEARLPRPHAHARRPRHPVGSPRQGAHRALGLSRAVLARPHRLTRGAEYKAVVRRGRRCAGAHTVTYVNPAAADGPARFGFIVSRQVGGAVVRNTVRRRLKALCAEALPALLPGNDIVIRALPGADTISFAALRDEVAGCLARRAA